MHANLEDYLIREHWVDNGQIVLSGRLLRLANLIDSKITALASRFSPIEHQFPSFIDSKSLKKIGHIHSFPEHASFVTCLHQGDDALWNFQSNKIFSEDGSIQVSNLTPTHHLLTPSTCYHFYIAYQNMTLKDDLYLTANCVCYRREKEYIPLERQWNFNMREIACIGSYDDTIRFVESMTQAVAGFVEYLKLDAQWECAQEPLFGLANSTPWLTQKMSPNKTELLFDNRLALASANIHHDYFGETFEIMYQGKPAYSATLAFGIERWIAAILQSCNYDNFDVENVIRNLESRPLLSKERQCVYY